MQEKHVLGLLEEWSSGLTDVQPRRLRMVGLEKQWCQNGGARTLRSRYASKCIAACDRYVIGEASLVDIRIRGRVDWVMTICYDN